MNDPSGHCKFSYYFTQVLTGQQPNVLASLLVSIFIASALNLIFDVESVEEVLDLFWCKKGAEV